MSYDYNQLVETIQSEIKQARDNSSSAAEHYDKASTAFQELSQKCDMTPLLWMQYSDVVAKQYRLLMAGGTTEVSEEDSKAARELQLSTLEMGLSAFPGCAMLRLYALELMMQDNEDRSKIHAAFQEALLHVGRGSHCNEGEIVSRIYNMYAEFLVTSDYPAQAKTVYLQRARVPLKDFNDGIQDEFRTFCEEHQLEVTTEDFQSLDESRRYVARTFGMLQSHEDDVDVAMNNEQILTRHEFPLKDGVDVPWEDLLKQDPTQCRLWNGLGGMQTAQAFVNYAQTASRFVARIDEDEEESEKEAKKQAEETIQSMAILIYERGISECPTVEFLWQNYLKHLMYLVRNSHLRASKSQLQSVAKRATRNCPYSSTLFQLRLHSMLVLAEAGLDVLDPETIVATVKEAAGAKFFSSPSQYLSVWTTAVMTMKRRIMSLLANQINKSESKTLRYDDAEPLPKKGKDQPGNSLEMDEEVETELQDLVEEVRETYDAADEYLRKEHASWTEGRTILWKDRGITEEFLLTPLMASLDEDETNSPAGSGKESLRCFHKVVSVHQPPHPDSYATYIDGMLHTPVSLPIQLVRKLRNVRALYQKAMSTVGKNKGTSEDPANRDREVALHSLCHDYLQFELTFGSDESYSNAAKLGQKKLEAFAPVTTTVPHAGTVDVVPASDATKRKRSTDETDASTKRPRTADSDGNAAPMEIDATESSQDKAALHKKKDDIPKVRVGKLDYPAHPFTVRVTNLASDTEDMDLVDEFRPRCGTIVHAKIVRDKNFHGKGKSKGWGLIQFEERESVDKALALNDVIGIHEKIVRVSRSHVPAAGLVPPGMHRVNPKGEGKSSKRNQKKREEKDEKAVPTGVETAVDNDVGEKAKKPAPSTASTVLAFRPRGVAHGHRHHKIKLNLSTDDDNDKK